MTVILFGCELGRAFLLQNLSKRHNQVYLVIVSIVMAMFRIPLSQLFSMNSGLKLMDFITKIAFPELMQSYVASNLAALAGPLSAIVYLGIIRAFEYLSPYLPTPEWMPLLLFNLLVPVLGLTVLRLLYLKEAAIKERTRESEEARMDRGLSCFRSNNMVCCRALSIISISHPDRQHGARHNAR